LEAEAKRHNVSVVQLALAWLLQKSPVITANPGNIVARPSRREYGRHETSAYPGLEED
jgi:hypothetical protein